MSDQHVGVRRRPPRLPLRRVVPLVAGLVMVAWVLALAEPDRALHEASAPVNVTPTWEGPATVDIPGVLDDGAAYTPRLYVDAQTSVGVASAADGAVRVILARAPGGFTELRSVPAQDRLQVNGFAVDGDTLVWLETTARSGGGSLTTLWRASVSGQAPPAQVTTNTGETSFYGLPAEVLVAGGRVTWTALAPDQTPRTEVRSVALTGGQVDSQRLDGELLLSTPPWATSVPAGPGSAVTLVHLSTGERVTVTVGPDEAAVCDPQWCRLAVTDASGLIGVDLMRLDGAERRRVAGANSTPVISQPMLLDRYLPLAVDRAEGVGLSLYDVARDETRLIAPRAGNVGGRGGVLWWSTGLGAELTWHALDLSLLS